ncbi:carbonic anhydrase [Patellaria atrata CBS 101060]|uniref:Carbonic anhydrase n=1 Tax=Patellaria atrata CBS 101060 TaxID=1346257 RepID=A0A9P4VMH9_9PEZI|nr:carbonic anhydrase [Patellaria atrata CBS 101060]
MVRSLFIILNAVASTLSCSTHSNYRSMAYEKHQIMEEIPEPPRDDWTYEASFNWGRVNENYTLCQTGAQQSPISLGLNNGFSRNHRLRFDYPDKVTGNFYNWNYGPAFTVINEGEDWAQNPSVSYDNETLYLKGWHIHCPAEHSVANDRSKAELHLVHVDTEGHEKVVLAIRLDPGHDNSIFFEQLPPMIGFNETKMQQEIGIDIKLALAAVQNFNEFWTYEGSLTSPPCEEGIRWFVARQIFFTSVKQMQMILRASTYSARPEQEVWLHRINE